MTPEDSYGTQLFDYEEPKQLFSHLGICHFRLIRSIYDSMVDLESRLNNLLFSVLISSPLLPHFPSMFQTFNKLLFAKSLLDLNYSDDISYIPDVFVGCFNPFSFTKDDHAIDLTGDLTSTKTDNT